MTSVSFGNENLGLQVGVNEGTIYMNPERSETPPAPLSTIPFRRDPDFVDCGTPLDLMNEKASVSGAPIALVGLGGVGKSQLAIEYCYRIRDRSLETWIFWVHAGNPARFEQSCRDIADRLKIPNRQNPKENIFRLLNNWLQNEKNGKWVLVLDNLDHHLFHEVSTKERDGLGSDIGGTPERSIWEIFHPSLNGLIVITSRSRRIALSMVEDSDIILVEPMDESHATKLFEKKLGSKAVGEEVIQLATALEFMPLAIVQAAAYIKQRSPRLPSAADLLSFMSFFDRQGIPDGLLRGDEWTKDIISNLYTQDLDEKVDAMDQEERASESSYVSMFEDDILMLRDYSMISVVADGEEFEMHRLVQLAIQEWLKANKQLERWKKRFIKTLYQTFPAGKYENWARCQSLFAHVQCAIFQKPDTDASLTEWALLLHDAASFAWTRGDFINCKTMAEKACQTFKKLFGPEDEKTLASAQTLGLAYYLSGELKRSEDLLMQVFMISNQVLGPEHLNTILSMGNLASNYHFQNRLKEAEDLEAKVIEISRVVLGPEHSHTLTIMNNLASTYRDQGRWKEAEELGMQVIEIRKRVSGPEHPDTLTSILNLASTYRDQGRWKEAEELDVQLAETYKRVLGSEHPDTLLSMGNLASTYHSQGRLKEAEELGVQVLETRKRVLGPEHPGTLTGMNNLALTYRDQGRWKKAEELGIQVIEIRERVSGPEHPGALIGMNNLASTYRDQGRWKEAEELGMQVIEIRKRVSGPEHPDTLTSILNLASTYRDQGRWKEAEELDVQLAETYKRVLGSEHPSTLLSMVDLASTYHSQGRLKEAEELGVQVLETRKRVLGPEHPDTLTCSNILASIYRDQGRWEEAEELGTQVLETHKRILGPEHLDTLTSMANLVSIYWKQSRRNEANELSMQLGLQVMNTGRQMVRLGHPRTLIRINKLAHVLKSSGQDAVALLMMAECVLLFTMHFGLENPRTMSLMSTLTEWGGRDDSLSAQSTHGRTGGTDPNQSHENFHTTCSNCTMI
ncbi:P-loop containing nucleoside triphosphate hydrolase protein [Penicillium pulvis]|uniref:P-loop containing nucleoside triphosphate hydrolase protein n=1 Tax=Penicillium pulvis TaxID=1562058 RepID=UPI00254958AD|nr:P-loop containing nucleoside triphosphate hydrolase protein [Penicillium pulvis]KAJ5784460.1 P-loop containing nucleoside triphosphate hydrolase protein [Penicillium pulvis]